MPIRLAPDVCLDGRYTCFQQIPISGTYQTAWAALRIWCRARGEGQFGGNGSAVYEHSHGEFNGFITATRPSIAHTLSVELVNDENHEQAEIIEIQAHYEFYLPKVTAAMRTRTLDLINTDFGLSLSEPIGGENEAFYTAACTCLASNIGVTFDDAWAHLVPAIIELSKSPGGIT